MFINCPTCRALVATDPATDRAPPYCPICSAPIEQAATAPSAPEHDRAAIRDDASRRLDEMLSSIEHHDDAETSLPRPDVVNDGEHHAAGLVTPPAAAADPDADTPLEAGPASQLSPIAADASGSNRDGDGDGDLSVAADMRDDPDRDQPGRVRLRPPGPAPIDVIRSPVDALPEAGLNLPPAASMIEDPRSIGIAGMLRRLIARRSAGETPADAHPRASLDATHAADAADVDDRAQRETPVPALTVADARVAVSAVDPGAPDHAGVATDVPVAVDAALLALSHDTDGVVAAAHVEGLDDTAIADHGTEPPPLRPAIVRPVDRPRVELPIDPRLPLDPSDSEALIDPPSVIAAPLVSTRPLGVPAARSAPSFARPRRAVAHGIGWASGAAIAVLGIALTLQLLLADRSALAADARWRPAIAALCSALHCALPPWREPAALTLVDRDVHPHPTRPGTLRVTASFRNDARWPQPWPRLALTLSDVDGASLAMRDFSAGEYLGAAPRQDLLAPGQTASIAMDVIEPDTRSVAFDFELH